jgi:ADP-heptose:LPS heptosyltransferase
MYSNGKKLFKCLVKNTAKPLSLRQFAERRNKIYIRRRAGGLGDIIMHRMLFESLRQQYPEFHITFGCPLNYMTIAQNHPFLDEVVNYEKVDANDYGVCYDTTTRCRVYEAMTAPNCDIHRSDIWAASMGLELKQHEIHYTINPEKIIECKEKIEAGNKKTVLFVPWSNNGGEKNLSFQQVEQIVKEIQQRGFFVYGLSQEPQPIAIKTLVTNDLNHWANAVAAADYILTIDTAAFHLAGGLKKPMVGIFAWTNGKVYGKYFDFILVQKHRDDDPTWCGPCGNWGNCPKWTGGPLPCAIEILPADVLEAFDQLIGNKRKLPIIP